MFVRNATLTQLNQQSDTDTWDTDQGEPAPRWAGRWPAYFTEEATRRRDADGADITATSRTLILQGGLAVPMPNIDDLVVFETALGEQTGRVESAMTPRGHSYMPEYMRTVRLKLADTA